MGPDRLGRWPASPVRLEYQRLRLGATPPGRPADPLAAAVRLTGATAATVVVGCLTVAVPCLVFAAVGLWFDDVSTLDAAGMAAATGTAAALAAVPAVLCHRRLARRPARWPPAEWN